MGITNLGNTPKIACSTHGLQNSTTLQCPKCKSENEAEVSGEPRKPQIGTWTLTAPDGTEFKAESPMKCCRKEQETRVPKEVAMERLFASMNKCFLCEEEDYKFTLGEGTPAEIKVCLPCKNTLLASK